MSDVARRNRSTVNNVKKDRGFFQCGCEIVALKDIVDDEIRGCTGVNEGVSGNNSEVGGMCFVFTIFLPQTYIQGVTPTLFTSLAWIIS